MFHKKEENKKEKNCALKDAMEITWKDFYKDKSPKERYYLLKEELERITKDMDARRKAKCENLENNERRINFIAKNMEEGFWCGQSTEDKERVIAEKNAFHKAEREAEQKKAGIIAEMEAIIKADKKIPADDKLH